MESVKVSDILSIASSVSVVLPLVFYLSKIKHASKRIHIIGALIIASALCDLTGFFSYEWKTIHLHFIQCLLCHPVFSSDMVLLRGIVYQYPQDDCMARPRHLSAILHSNHYLCSGFSRVSDADVGDHGHHHDYLQHLVFFLFVIHHSCREHIQLCIHLD